MTASWVDQWMPESPQAKPVAVPQPSREQVVKHMKLNGEHQQNRGFHPPCQTEQLWVS